MSTMIKARRANGYTDRRYGYPRSEEQLWPAAWVLVLLGLCTVPMAAALVHGMFTGDLVGAVFVAVLFFGPVVFRIVNQRDFPVVRVVMGVLSVVVGFLAAAGDYYSDETVVRVIVMYYALGLPTMFIVTEKLHIWYRDAGRRRQFLRFLDAVQNRTDVELCIVDRVKPSGARPRVLMRDAITGVQSKKRSVWLQGVQPGMLLAVTPDHQVVAWVRQECLEAANKYR